MEALKKAITSHYHQYFVLQIREENIKNYKDIPIEERNSEELSHIEGLDEQGKLQKIQIYPKNSKAMNLAFDVTPAKYITGLITEKGVCEASEKGLKELFK